MRRPRASIVLPTWNGERHLARLVPALQRQELDGGLEILAVDSSSQDGTRELLAGAGARVTRIPQAEFGHGRTRNRAARDASGEFLVFLSQDACPEGERFLATLLGAFEDPRVAGAYARVLPPAGCDPLTERTALAAPEASDRPRVQELDGRGGLAALAPKERAEVTRFNDVASAIRRSVFAELPFLDVDFGEDVAWARAALEAGHRIAFVPEAVVRHAHRYGPRQAFARYRTDAAFQRRVNGLALRPSLLALARGLVREVGLDLGYLARHDGPGRLAGLVRSPALRAAQVLGQFAGSRG